MRYVEEIVRNLVAELRLWLGRRRGAVSPPGIGALTVRSFTAPQTTAPSGAVQTASAPQAAARQRSGS